MYIYHSLSIIMAIVVIQTLSGCMTHQSIGLVGADEKVINGHWTAINKSIGVSCIRDNGDLVAKASIAVEALGDVSEYWYKVNCRTGESENKIWKDYNVDLKATYGKEWLLGYDEEAIRSHDQAMCRSCAKHLF